MNPEDIGRILDEIGERIGPAGAYAWGLAVRYQIIDGILGAVVGLGIAAVSVFAMRFAWRQTSQSEDIDRGFVRMIAALIGFPLLVFSIFWIGGSLVQLMNPEWSAIKSIISAAKP